MDSKSYRWNVSHPSEEKHATQEGSFRQLDPANCEPPVRASNGLKRDDTNGLPSASAETPAAESPTKEKSQAVRQAKKKMEKKVSFFGLFRFADSIDVCLMIFGTFAAIGTGIAFPFNLYYFGNMITTFAFAEVSVGVAASMNLTALRALNRTDGPLKCFAKFLTNESFPDESIPENATAPALFDIIVDEYIVVFCGIAVAVLILSYISMSSWVLTAERQVRRVRMAFFKSVMKQDIGWFDTYEAGELNTRMSDDLDRLHDGFGDKMATFIQWVTTFVGGFTVGLIQGWQLALVMIAASPLLAIAAAVMGRIIRTFVTRELKAYAKAGALATEVLTAIRTVTAFGGQKKAEAMYEKHLSSACQQGIKKSMLAGATAGTIWIIMFSTFAMAFWYGAKLVREDCMETGVILQVFIGVFAGALSLGNAAPLLENFANARGAAATLFEIIDQKSAIDGSTDEGEKPAGLRGDIEVSGVHFSYPARPDVKIMSGLSLNVRPGQTVALVGPSGCGKSTVIQLLQRFYDPQGGCVKLDGKDIRQLNIRWLRSKIGVVGQEPVLFSASIEDNIRLGGTDVGEEDMVRACKAANCYDFIMNLPEKFKTLVGERGAQLSGGQKQRIAIARALVSDPRILLLDEATSALDTQSEAIVQEALDKASQGRTTIIIAHRLSTVRNADLIIALKDGNVVESGKHDDLMKREGLYYSLHMMQIKKKKDDSEIAGSDEDDQPDMVAPVRGRALSSHSASKSSDGRELEQTHFRRSGRSSTVGSRHSGGAGGHAFVRAVSSKGEGNHDGFVRASVRSLQDGARLALASLQSKSLSGYTDAVLEDAYGQDLEDKEAEAQAVAQSQNVDMKRIYALNMPEFWYIVIGSIAAVLSGSTQPAFALLMSQIIGVIGITLDVDSQEKQVTFWCLILVAAGIGSAIAALMQISMYGISGERLTERLRLMSFRAMLRQEMGWFDAQQNQVGILTARLATDASQIKGATGARIGVTLQSLATITAAIVVSYVYCWQLALVMMFFMPLTIGSGMVQHRVLHGFARGDKYAMEEGGRIAQEVISNIRTVVSLNKEEHFVDKFVAHFKKLYKRDRVKSFLAGISFSCSQSLVYFGYAICYSYGAYLIDTTRGTENPVQFYYLLRVFSAFNFGGISVGRAIASAPDYSKAKVAAEKMLTLFDRKSLIDSADDSGATMTHCEGNVAFKDVTFRYPTRPTVPILRGLTVSVQKGERLALVGASGCGKSTAVGLMERFYDPLTGSVTLDGLDLGAIKVQDLRKQIGLVSQEPILFDTSIAENIAYGDNTRRVPMTDIIEAAKKANIHDFVVGLPKGYETQVGDKGTQLSGGQKQRIAIARALLRNPRLLLLDEATSALDTESEKVVQEALEQAQEGRTCIIIAHRLSTIKNASRIAVIHQGRVAELGSHDELLASQQLYYKLVNAQL